MSTTFRIAVIPSDGIGKEVMPEGVRMLYDAARRFKMQLQYEQIEWASCDWYAGPAR
jgi:tartrate dehydrogenase/decarboxylase/D-malate dehydrogenase